MNYLAHAYLSFNHPEVLVGNIISDFVKGKQQYTFSKNIQAGIQLHRRIDAFTDDHKSVKAVKEIFKPEIALYAGAFVDIAFDYFLANDKSIFSTENDLILFTQKVYATLDKKSNILPAKFLDILPHMKDHNWLWGYSKTEGIKKSFAGVTKRANYINQSHNSFQVFISNLDAIQLKYDDFINDLIQYSKQEFDKLFLYL